MNSATSKHPLIRAVSWLAIAGGMTTLLVSLFLLNSVRQQHQWPLVNVSQSGQSLYYQLDEKRYPLTVAAADPQPISKVYVNPANPNQYVSTLPSYWWHLYLCMAGLIVLYAGLHLRQERDRNIQSLGFE